MACHCLRTHGDPFTVEVLTGTYVISGDPTEARKLFTPIRSPSHVIWQDS